MNEISEFTSHYVSINSINSVDEMQLAVNLHPTMYLLIHIDFEERVISYENLHPTMYLLIQLTRVYQFSFQEIYIPLCIY